jgi:tocopherol cyclase
MLPLAVGALHPDGFHGARVLRRVAAGRRVRSSFFEGWYVKLISADRARRVAVIPGVFLAEDGSILEAFVQVLDGVSGTTSYHRFPASAFEADGRGFDVRVGPNRFSATGIHLELPDLSGEVRFGAFTRWPVTLREPGAMGWYAWVPTMECYHGVVSLDHPVSGSLQLQGSRLDFTEGRGYIEKDWGTAFPQAHVWMQTNHFDVEGVSLVASTALIPWRRSTFRGDLVALRLPGTLGDLAGLHRFTTYTRARTVLLEVTDDQVRWTLAALHGRRLELHAVSGGAGAGLLHAPVRTQMHQRVPETLGGQVDVRLLDEHGSELFAGRGSAAGIEVHGRIDRLLATPGR